jgi:hypothetical protein
MRGWALVLVAGCGGGGGASVSACEDAVTKVEMNCTNPSEVCVYEASKDLCTTGRTAFVQAVYECLAAAKCNDPGVPGVASDCVDAAIDKYAVDEDRTYGQFECACNSSLKGCDHGLPYFALEEVMLLTPHDVSEFADCSNAMGCDSEQTCATQGTLEPLATCH